MMKILYFLFEFLYVKLMTGIYTFKCFILRLEIQIFRFKRGQLLLKRSKLLAQKDKPILLDGGRAVLGNQLLDTIEDVHEIVTPNGGAHLRVAR